MKYRIRKSLEKHQLKSYLHGDQKMPENPIDCSLGINPFGCSESITKEVFASMYDTIMPYPSYPYNDLKKAITEYLAPIDKFETSQITLQAGSINMLIDLNRLFVEDGTRVLVGEPSFTSAITDMRANGGIIDAISLDENDKFKFSVDAYKKALKPEHTLVYIDNPNNPTGQVIPISELEELAKVCLAQDTVLLIDEAYGDFMDLENSGASLVNKYDNVIVTKTLSKGFGLAGLRCGYVLVPKSFVQYMQKLPAEMVLTEVAARIMPYALKDKKHIETSREKIKINKDKLISSLSVLKSSLTGDTVPITLLYTDKDVDLYALFLKYGIITERGEDFDGIGKRHVRIRVPKDIDELLPRIAKIEEELKSL